MTIATVRPFTFVGPLQKLLHQDLSRGKTHAFIAGNLCCAGEALEQKRLQDVMAPLSTMQLACRRNANKETSV